MSLIQCSECKRDILTTTTSCPHCGFVGEPGSANYLRYHGLTAEQFASRVGPDAMPGPSAARRELSEEEQIRAEVKVIEKAHVPEKGAAEGARATATIVVVSVVAALVLIGIVATGSKPRPSDSGETRGIVTTSAAEATSPVSYGKATFDPLDAVPARIGDLRISAAWRVSASGVDEIFAIYRWEDTPASVSLFCSFPPHGDADCDASTPIRFRIGKVKACGAARDEAGSGPGRGGPFIDWETCSLRIDKSGQRVPRGFDRLKAAAADAVPWTHDLITNDHSNVDMAAIMGNRMRGLLAASRVGNSELPTLRNQLD